MGNVEKRIYGLQFWLLCLSSFLFFASFNMVIPELPNYLSSMGGEDYKGLIIAIFTLTAGLSRPFSGRLADTVGRIPVMVIGSLVCFFSGLIYPFVGSVFALLLLRFFHGFSTGFKPTGTSAYIADIVAFNRRGEALGVLGVCASTGMALGPSIGPILAARFSLDFMFYTSSVMGLLSVLVLVGMRETVSNKVPFRWGLLRITRKDIFEPRVIAPSIVLLLSVYSFGIILTVIPDFSLHLGLENEGKGLFFTYFTIASILIRFIAGKASDKYGRPGVLKISTIGITLAMIYIGFAEQPWELFLGAGLLGLAAGMNAPAAFAWTIDLSHPTRRGKAMATMYIALEIGIGLGALISGWTYANDPSNFPLTFLIGGLFAFASFLYLLFGNYQKKIMEENL